MTQTSPAAAFAPMKPRTAIAIQMALACSSAVLIYAAFCASYVVGVAPVVGEDHFPLNPSLTAIILCGATVVPLAAIAGVGTRPSQVMIWIFLTLLVIPTLTMTACGGIAAEFVGLVIGAYLVCALAGRQRLPSPIARGLISASAIEGGGLVLSLVTLALLAGIVGRPGFNVDLNEVYTYRASATELMPSLLHYLIHICTKVTLPVVLCLALHRNSVGRATVCLFSWFAFFALSGHKAMLAYPAVTIAAYALGSCRRAPTLIMASLLTLSVAGTADLVDYSAHGNASIAMG